VSKSTRSRRANKSPKPYPEFPLTAHRGTGRWRKIHQGKSYYFGPLADWQGALERFNRQWPYIISGREAPPENVADGGLRLADLADEFLNAKRNRLTAGELSARSFRAYYETCAAMIGQFGKERRVDDLRPDDFESYRAVLAAKYGVVGLKNEINRCRVVFKFAHDNRLIERPVSFGQAFNRPSAKTLRIARNDAGPRMIESDELRRILNLLDGKEITLDRIDEETGKPVKVKRTPDAGLRAMVLLAANGGLGNTDVASLPQSAIDESGWLNFPRPKTGIRRRIPLWKETIDALQAAIAMRPDPVDPADGNLCFLTPKGNPWVRVRVSIGKDGKEKHVPMDALTQKFADLLKMLGINGHRGFYAVRHAFETIGGESRDQVAVNAIMGHVDSSMAGAYRERISGERLQAVVDTVRAWLWPEIVKEPTDAPEPG